MKFFSYFALFATASAIKLNIENQAGIKAKLPDLTDKQTEQLINGAKSEIRKDGDITWKEFKRGIWGFCREHGIHLSKSDRKELW